MLNTTGQAGPQACLVGSGISSDTPGNAWNRGRQEAWTRVGDGSGAYGLALALDPPSVGETGLAARMH